MKLTNSRPFIQQVENCNFLANPCEKRYKGAVTATPNILKGSLYALVAFFCMAVFGILTKTALQHSSVIWVSLIAYAAGTVVLFPFIAHRGLTFLKSEHYAYLLGRAIFGAAASFLYTIAIHYIPIVNGTLLFNTAPLFIPILTVLFLKNRLGKGIWLAVVVGFVGVIVIIKPTLAIFTQTGNLIGLFSGISLAIAYLLMKLLTATDPGIRIIFYYLGIGMLIQIPLLLFVHTLPSQETCIYALLSGVMLVLAQLALVKAYQYAEASQIGIYQYTSVAFVGLLDWLLWNAVPTGRDLIGVVLVTLAGVIIIRSGNGSSRRAKNTFDQTPGT